MKSFAIGLGIGLVGAVLWLITGLLWGIGQTFGSEAPILFKALYAIGFIVMIGSPLTFWVILPIKHLITR